MCELQRTASLLIFDAFARASCRRFQCVCRCVRVRRARLFFVTRYLTHSLLVAGALHVHVEHLRRWSIVGCRLS